MVLSGLSLLRGSAGDFPWLLSAWLLSKENRRKIEPKETPSCLIPCLLVVFSWQLEILVTTLVLSTDLSLEIPAEFQYRKSKSRDPQVCQLQGKSFITHFPPRPGYTGMICQPFRMSFWHLDFFGLKGWIGGDNLTDDLASIGRERVHCFNFLRSLYQCLAYFFQFFQFSFPLFNSFFSRNQYKTCWYTWSKLNWSFDFVFLSGKCWVYCVKSSSWNRHILIVMLKKVNK